ncbi:MAG TPA: FAD-dependent oxidoreductase [Pseudonocardiaceae bacterium]|jgi:glycine/D-amino acid oxidase-like deaminating enzyme|nr:FAD-dependent oxidoreductase [Pseudonocardiaceae bacterium]
MGTRTTVVVGAGAIGASTAFHLARRGVRVHCVDRADRAGSGTTAVGFGTATAYRRFPKAYFDINRAGIAEHTALADELSPARWWHRSGTVAWSDEESFTGYLDLLTEWGCPLRRYSSLTAGVALGESVAFPAGGPVAMLPDEGWIDAVDYAERLLVEARSLGATVTLGTAVESISLADGQLHVHLADGRHIPADVLINATGSAADDIAEMVGARPFLGPPRRSLIAHLLVDGEPLRHILRAPDISIRPDGPGRVVMRSDRVDKLLPANAGADPELVKELLDRAARVVPLLGSGTVRDAEVVAARCPRDELPSVGPLAAVPGYYEAVASAGVTLAPVFGRLLAEHVVDGTVSGLIAPFSPNRFGHELADSLADHG